MIKKEFDQKSSGGLAAYYIEATLPENAQRHEQMLRAAHFRIAVRQWVEEETGMEPNIDVVDDMLPKSVVLLRCNEALIRRIEAHFAKDIAAVWKAPTRDDFLAGQAKAPKP